MEGGQKVEASQHIVRRNGNAITMAPVVTQGFSWSDSGLCITAQFSHIETHVPSFLTMPQLKILKMTPPRLRLYRPGTLKTGLLKGLKINLHTSRTAPRAPKRPRPQTRNLGGKRKNNTAGHRHRYGVETKQLRRPVSVQPTHPM